MAPVERARRRREADVRRVVHHRREVDDHGDQGLLGLGRLHGRQRHVEHRGPAVVVRGGTTAMELGLAAVARRRLLHSREISAKRRKERRLL
jgi:hypothetical protein